ncbi:DUF6531 domain-containing protein [Aestuariivirga litoralis]|uniref:DUF6531 domain-containing protein n=1 Tax=Aestuariivirga litoralis TaxID=2650924 RepID=UPI00137A7FC9|nr:DUF6531 domain-containing protein [Aestuariivirga litoralis]
MDVLTGRKHQEVLDWSSGGSHPLELRRTYSSSPFTLVASPYSSIGRGWRTNFDARARWSGSTLAQADWVHVVLPDQFEYHFNKQAGVWRTMIPRWGGSYRASSVIWQSRSDLDASLSIAGDSIVLRTPGNVDYVFDSAAHAPDAQYRSDGLRTSVLTEIRFQDGYTQKLSYTGDFATRVTDTLGRWIEFDYEQLPSPSRFISRARASDGQMIRYAYQNRFPSLELTAATDFWALSSVIYPDATPSDADNPRVSYEYNGRAGRPSLLLTGITDERGVRFASWTYDSKDRVLSSEHAGGAERWEFAYDDAGGTVTVTNPLGRATRYTYHKVIGGLRQLVAVDGIATSNCVASNTSYIYDANGFRTRAVDAEGRVTEWTRDRRGRPLATREAVGTPQAQTSSTAWDANRPLPTMIARPGVTTSFTYNGAGQIAEVKETSTLSLAAPYKSGGEVRSTRYSYLPFALPPLPPNGPTGPALEDVGLPVTNPSASEGVTGWTSTTGILGVRVSSPCDTSNPCFYGSRSPWVVAYQDVAIPAGNIAEVDAGLRAASVGWLQGRWSAASDYAAVGLLFLNAEGQRLASTLSPLAIPVAWTPLSRTAPVPAATRTIRIVLLIWRNDGSNNDGYIDDITLSLTSDGSATPHPFLAVVNGSASDPSGAGWETVVEGTGGGPAGPVTVAASSPCQVCTFFTNADTVTGSSHVGQRLVVPRDRYREVDAGQRGLDLSISSWANKVGGEVNLEVDFLDASGRPLGLKTNSFASAVDTVAFRDNRFVVPVIPPGTRQVALRIATSFPLQPAGSRSARWTDVTARLVDAVRPPAGAIQLLAAVDGPLPGPSDTVRYGYDAAGNLTSVTDELGHVTRVTALDAGGRPLSVTDPNGVVTAMAYDARGRLTTVTVNPGAGQARTVIAYDAVGQVTQVTAPDGSFLRYGWNDARWLATVTNNLGERIDYGYNANGDQTSRMVKSASGAIVRQQSALFDELGRLMRSIGAAGQQTAFAYDRTDNLTEVKDPRGGLFGYSYDGLQRLAKLIDETGARVELMRDAQDQITAYRDPRGLTTTYVRNGFGEVIAESGPDVGTTVIMRDERGLPVRVTDPRGIVTVLTYDGGGRLLKEAHPADPAQDVTYGYDDARNGNKGLGRLTGITDQSGSLSRSYDALGRIVAERRVIAGKSYVTRYGYNAAGRLTAIGYPSGRVVGYSRDAVGRVSAVTTRATATAAVDTVASGLAWAPMSSRLTRLTHGNGLAATRAYDRDGRLTALRLADGTARLSDLSYAYGDGMNLTEVNDNVAAARSIRLAYDAAQRLAYARGPWGSLTYGYTPTGDRAREELTPPGGGAPLTTLLRYPATSNRLAATSVNDFTTRSFAYDAAGNMVSAVMGAERMDIAYNLRNRPVSVTRTGDGLQTSQYAYNALEQLVQRRTTAPGGPRATVHYIHGLDGSLLAEADAATGATPSVRRMTLANWQKTKNLLETFAPKQSLLENVTL